MSPNVNDVSTVDGVAFSAVLVWTRKNNFFLIGIRLLRYLQNAEDLATIHFRNEY